MNLEASCHSYLGNNLRDSKIRQAFSFDNSREYEVLLIPFKDIVLFPFETIPLRIHDPTLIGRIKQITDLTGCNTVSRECTRNDIHIGVVYFCPSDNYKGRTGTTIEITASHCSNTTEEFVIHSPEELVLTAKGRYRFKIVSVRKHSNLVYASVKILQDSSGYYSPNYRCQEAYNPFPRWAYEVISPKALARQAYELAESTLFWKVRIIQKSLRRAAEHITLFSGK